jgi:hypothetical protein
MCTTAPAARAPPVSKLLFRTGRSTARPDGVSPARYRVEDERRGKGSIWSASHAM